jgi:hypothetical protein
VTAALSGTDVASFSLTGADIGDIAVAGTDTFTVTPIVTAVGTYTATVTVSGSNSISASFGVSYEITAPALTGTVTISGTAQVGQTLTADTTGLGGSGTISYQWIRGASTNISGATGSTYELVADDEGQTIKVQVSRADNSGSVTGGPTGAVAAAPTTITLANLAAYLASLPANTAETPHTVILDDSITINTSDTSTSGVWATINRTVGNQPLPRRYVILDLSACTATGNWIGGDFSPTGNHFNIIKTNSDIKGIILPATLTGIGDFAFFGCSGLTSVTIPVGVTSIGDGAFICGGLTAFTVAAANTAYSAQDGILYNKNKTTLMCVPQANSGSLTNLPSTLTSIGDGAFAFCTGLAGVTIPGSVTSIGEAAFVSTGLTSVTFGTGSNITTAWDDETFSTDSLDAIGTSLWNAYTAESKAGRYTLSGTTWTQME